MLAEFDEKERATRMRQFNWWAEQFAGLALAEITADRISQARDRLGAATFTRGMSPQHVSVIVRSATEADLKDIDELLRQFVHGHPAKTHPRPLSRLREAYFGASPVAHLLVACKGSRVIGMGQWTRIYDMFWAMFAGRVEWLFVIRESPPQSLRKSAIRYARQVGSFCTEPPAVRTLPRYTRAPPSAYLAMDSICLRPHFML